MTAGELARVNHIVRTAFSCCQNVAAASPDRTKIWEAQQQHDIQDTIVVVERTGNYYLPPKRAFAKAGLETRVLHPFATKQYRVPADPGNKTDETDLYAQHRAAVAGFGLAKFELESPYRELQLRARHRRNLVEKAAASHTGKKTTSAKKKSGKNRPES